jgi:hypothetical protein
MGAQLAAPVATGVGHSAAVSLSHGQAGKAQKRSGNPATAALDRPPIFPHKAASSGRFAFKPPLTMQMVQSSALPGKSVIIV